VLHFSSFATVVSSFCGGRRTDESTISPVLHHRASVPGAVCGFPRFPRRRFTCRNCTCRRFPRRRFTRRNYTRRRFPRRRFTRRNYTRRRFTRRHFARLAAA
jgi:hypothetical protein